MLRTGRCISLIVTRTNSSYLRQVSLQIGPATLDGLDIDFEVDSNTGDKNKASTTITVWNLSPETIAAVHAEDDVLLVAGYQGDAGCIFCGQVTTITHGRDGADRYTEFGCVDLAWPKNMQPRIYPKGTFVSDILRNLYHDAAFLLAAVECLEVTTSGPYTTDPDGSVTLQWCLDVVNGDPDIKKTGRTIRAMTAGGESYIVPDDVTLSATILVSIDTGLISTSPEDGDNYDRSVTTLLNWRVMVGSAVELESLEPGASGRYVVAEYAHSSSEFTTTMKLKASGGEE